MTPTRRATQGNDRRPIDSNHDSRIELVNPAGPLFEWVVTGNQTCEVRDFAWLTGETSLRLPTRPYSGDATLPQVIVPTSPLAINLATTGAGGLVDGIALASEATLLAWAFTDNALSNEYHAVGVTTLPRVAITGAPSVNGGLGTLATFPVTANHANRLVVGSRVRIYEALTPGSNYNHGTVTANVGSNISVQLDASYGLATNNNTTLTGAAAKTCVQLNEFEPRIFNGTTTALDGRPFTYIGSIHLDTSSNIRYTRKRGDILLLPEGVQNALSRTGITASETFTLGLGNWLPLGAKDVYAILYSDITAGAAGNARNLIATDANANVEIDLRHPAGAAGMLSQPGTLTPKPPNCSVFSSYVETGVLTVTYTLSLVKYRETNY